MGRHALTLTEAEKAEVETLAAVLTAAQIADYFGIGRTTFFAMMARDEEIAERYKRGKARAIGAVAQSLISKARAGDTASMIFYLKTQAGWRETNVLEHSGSIGSPRDEADAAAMRRAVLDCLETKHLAIEAKGERVGAVAPAALLPVKGSP